MTSKVPASISRIPRRFAASTLAVLLLCSPVFVLAQSEAASQFKVLHTFTGKDGAIPWDALTMDKAGVIYGDTAIGGDLNCALEPGLGCGAVFALHSTKAGGWKEKVLHRFTSNTPDGAVTWLAEGPLVQDSQGNWYGTTASGGESCGCGTVYKIDTNGTESVIYAFTGFNGDGSLPTQPLVIDANGDIYGTTQQGGEFGYGTVFKISGKTGHEGVLHSFAGANGDGGLPSTGLIEDAAGNLYGTTYNGGVLSNKCPVAGCGTIFKITKTGKETILHNFAEKSGDGATPYGTPVLDSNGNLYGNTIEGGLGVGNIGTIYTVTSTGKGYKVLFKFDGNNGYEPSGPLTLDAAGNLYGTALQGGAFVNYGVVFELTTAGKPKVSLLHSFTGGKDGALPYGGVIFDSAGNLYGAAAAGGDLGCANLLISPGCGVIFEIAK